MHLFLVLFQIGEMRRTSRFPQFNRYRPPRRCLAWHAERWAVAKYVRSWRIAAVDRTSASGRKPPLRLVILIGLGLLFAYPPAGIVYLIVLAAWKPIKLFAGFLIGGYAAGLGFGRATRAPNINNRT